MTTSRTITWTAAVVLAAAVGLYLTLAIELKDQDHNSWAQSAGYYAIGSVGVAGVAFLVGWNALWLWPLATFAVAVVWEEFLWDEPGGQGWFTTDAIGAYPTVVMLLLGLLLPAAIAGAVGRHVLDRSGRAPRLEPLRYPRGTSVPRWVSLTALVLLWIAWFFVARWYLVHSGDRVFARFVSAECFSGSPRFAAVQTVVAATGLVVLAVAIAARVRESWAARRFSHVSFVAAMALLGAWVVLVLVFQPSNNIGIYGGCGGA